MPVVGAVAVLVLAMLTGAVLAYREWVEDLRREMAEVELDSTWRRVVGVAVPVREASNPIPGMPGRSRKD